MYKFSFLLLTIAQMELVVVPLHQHKKYTSACCRLINDEWKRSETARMRSLETSSDSLPTSLILILSDKVIGHLKLSAIPSIKDGCFVESVVIEKKLRGKGYGTVLMEKAEEYCKSCLNLKTIYLSTKGQEKFYSKLGYKECQPISIYGSYSLPAFNIMVKNKSMESNKSAPAPPPMPKNAIKSDVKTYMKKDLDAKIS